MVGLNAQAIWHDVECASYDADLPLWRELAESAGRAAPGAPILDVGCGTGRVALDLAARGYDVTGIDSEPELVEALARRARERGLGSVEAHTADARSFELGDGRRFGLAIVPMQVAQLLGGADGRRAMLACVRRHLTSAATLAIALADPFEAIPDDEEPLPPLPDVREEDGWVYSSTPINVRDLDGGATAIDRLRQAVSPEGDLDESFAVIVLDAVQPEQLEAEAREVGGYAIRERRSVPATADYVGSAVVMLEAA